jgi:hypothetical protein
MTATGLPDNSAPGAAEALGPSEQRTVSSSATATALSDGADIETRHRLRRALRILTAARRRDDGGTGVTDN